MSITPLPKAELELGGYWTDIGQPMISAISEAGSKIWTKYIGKSGKIWLLPKGEAENSMVIVEGEPGSQGFGGREMHFDLDDGTTIMLKGPWSSNHDSFFRDTGVDRRACYRTWGCIGRHRDHVTYTGRYDSGIMTICDLVYFDPEGGVIGEYDRIENLAKQMAFERDEILFKFQGTYGGSSSGCIMPYEGDPEYIAYRKRKSSFAEPISKTKWGLLADIYWAKYYAEFGDTRNKWDIPKVIACVEEAEGFEAQYEPPKSDYADVTEEDWDNYANGY